LNDWANVWLNASGGLPVFPVRGNQEYTASKSVWTDWIKTLPGLGEIEQNGPPGEVGLTYSFIYKNAMFVAMDEYASAVSADSPTISPTTLEWLAGQFAAFNRPHVFVYGHAPAYEIWDAKAIEPFKVFKDGLPSPAVLVDGKWKVAMNCEAVANVRDPFWNLLGVEGTGAYFCGHDHLFARGQAQDLNGNWVRQVIIGNGGAPTVPKFADDYVLPSKMVDPFIESAARQSQYCGSPMFQVEYCDQPTTGPTENQKSAIGYVVVEVHGSMAKATYKAKDMNSKTCVPDSGPFVQKDSWAWKFFAP
jgi:hypothetical protein